MNDTTTTIARADRKAANKALADAMRAVGLIPNGKVWEDTKALVRFGLEPEAAARLTRSLLPEAEQVKAIARAKGYKRIYAKAGIDLAPVRSREVSNEEAARIMREREAEKVEAAPISQAPKRLSSRAKDVKAGKVLRDAKGRLVSREVQEAFGDIARA